MNKIDELMRTYEATEAHLQKLGEEIEKLKQAKTGRWKPNNGEKYWCIDQDGDIYEIAWTDSYYDNTRYSVGNVFRTEEAEFEVERLKVIAELKEYASEFVKDSKNWGFYWSYYSKKIKYIWSDKQKHPVLCFRTEEIAQQAVEAVGEDRVKKYYLEVE